MERYLRNQDAISEAEQASLACWCSAAGDWAGW